MPEIKLENIEFGYDPKIPVIKGISYTLDKPEFICIMGPNGVGKSTLIHCLNKILKPTAGVVYMDGRDVQEMKLKELASHMGYVPASSQDSFPLTVVDTVMVGLQNDFKFGTNASDLQKVEHLAMKNFNELSAGQHQKVMLARGLVRTPEIVLLDEPTSNLDIKHQIQVTKTLSELPRTKGMMVIMISHDINITAKYADRIILISDGKVYADGTPLEVLTKENIRDVYDVEADVLEIEGRPHIILKDAIDDE